ncbi:MAG TPA: prepilin peptidase [Candidatus Deferrimicrobiaceae bacterium]|nr:prepilin peptidase [Candidatus Deferrimicrobiaceae bacterium]
MTAADGGPEMPFLALFLPGMFVLGACLGSFFNVLIYRLPREESIVLPASRCPSCGRPIRPAENIPLLGFLLLRGRCAGCGNRISWRYPGVEALTGAGFALLAWGDGIGFTLVRDLVFFSLLVPIVFIDIDHRIIPDELSLGGLAAGILLSFLPGGDWKGALAGGVLGGGILFVTAAMYHKVSGIEGLGGGDIKLIAMIGAFLGWRGALLTIFFGSLLGVGGGMFAMRKGKDGLKTAIPYGPYLCAAALIARFLGGSFWGFL